MSHSHAPGESCSGHGPQPPQQQQQQQLPPPDPALQALIEADFRAVDVKFGSADNTNVLCPKHSLELCEECDVDYVGLNRLAKLLASNPNIRCPPPAQVVSQQLTSAVTNMKDEGNKFFKQAQHMPAVARYTMAASIAVQRPPWENNNLMREELSTVLSNRSASFHESQDYISALVDAAAVVGLRRNWSKGHFRKAKALVGLRRWEEARDALRLGLSFEPNNTELLGYLADIDKLEEKYLAAKQIVASKQTGETKSDTPVAATA
jgi:translocation protein SEC72